MTDCLFCRIVVGEIPGDIVHRSESVMAFRDIQPKAKVHVLVVPQVHYETLAELAAAEPYVAAELLKVAGEVAADEGIAESGYRLVSNVGSDGRQEVGHVHLHVLGGEKLGTVAGRPVDSTP